jgi:hypothetical protein
MHEAVRDVATDSGALRRISGRPAPGGYEMLELMFDRGTLRLTCDADSDEIVVDVGRQGATDLEEIRDDEVLVSLVGKAIELAWIMVNNRGYADAFQIRCLDLATRSESCCQFEVSASVISVRSVSS